MARWPLIRRYGSEHAVDAGSLWCRVPLAPWRHSHSSTPIMRALCTPGTFKQGLADGRGAFVLHATPHAHQCRTLLTADDGDGDGDGDANEGGSGSGDTGALCDIMTGVWQAGCRRKVVSCDTPCSLRVRSALTLRPLPSTQVWATRALPPPCTKTGFGDHTLPPLLAAAPQSSSSSSDD